MIGLHVPSTKWSRLVKPISAAGIGTRFVVAFGLVSLSWNPTPVNYVRWAVDQGTSLTPVVVLAGLVLLVGWVVFLRATIRSLGPIGIGLALAIASVLLWTIIYYNVIDPSNSIALRWVLLFLLAAILTAGMSWSHLRRRWSGQADIDDVEDGGD